MRSTGVYFFELKMRLRAIVSAQGAWAFVLIILLIQCWVSFSGGVNEVDEFYKLLGLSKEGIYGGKVWQLLSYGFLHAGFGHVVLNSLCLLMLGAQVERVLGKAGVWKVILIGVLGGGVAHALVAGDGAEAPILVGASGGCMGLMLLLTTLSPDSRMWPLPVSARSLGIGVMGAELLMVLIDPQLELPGLSRMGEKLWEWGAGSWFSIGHACHFGGGMGGFLCGMWLLRPRVTAASLRRDRERREARRVR